MSKKAFVSVVEELEVYKQAYTFSLRIHKTTLAFPKIEQYELASQMRRASKSICANLAEGFAKQGQSKPEFRKFISNGIGSAGEMHTWCKYAKDLGYISEEISEDWRAAYRSIAKMLQKLRTPKDSNHQSQITKH